MKREFKNIFHGNIAENFTYANQDSTTRLYSLVASQHSCIVVSNADTALDYIHNGVSSLRKLCPA